MPELEQAKIALHPSSKTGEGTISVLEPSATGRVSVVIPCLDEAETIAECVIAARAALDENELEGEVIVVDNGSTDGSGALARAAGARVVEEPRRGYGSAYLAGLGAASGDYIVMIDADLTYDFGEIPNFVRDAGGRRGARCREPDARRATRGDALAESGRQPRPLRLPQRAASHERARRPLRNARAPQEHPSDPQPPHGRHGVRIGDGDPRDARAPRREGASDRAPSAGREPRSSRRSGTAGGICA